MRTLYLSLLVFALVSAPGVGEGQVESARIYVRRIEFQGVEGIADHVLRRELLQLEGGFLNTVALEQSRQQLERLPYVEAAQIFLRPIDGAVNQVDVVMAITQAPARRYGGGAGYSESQHLSVHGYFINENIFGTGQRFSATANASDFQRFAELSHTNPFINPARVSRTIGLASRRIERLAANATELEAELASAELGFGYRTGERHAITLGLRFNDVGLATRSVVSDQWVDWLQRNGNSTTRDGGSATDFWSAEFQLRWRQDTRNRPIFADRGLEQSVSFQSALPGSEVEYYTIDYALTKHWPLRGAWEARFDATLGYGARYGSETSSLPPYLNWFAGGPGSVRGYSGGGLGPRDSLGNPYGGNLLAAGQFELMLPLPEKWRERIRLGMFYDVGNVFSTEDVVFLDEAGATLDYDFDFSRLRRSAGIAARVLLPIGLVRLSYGIALNADDDHPSAFFRDDIDRLQIAFEVDF